MVLVVAARHVHATPTCRNAVACAPTMCQIGTTTTTTAAAVHPNKEEYVIASGYMCLFFLLLLLFYVLFGWTNHTTTRNTKGSNVYNQAVSLIATSDLIKILNPHVTSRRQSSLCVGFAGSWEYYILLHDGLGLGCGGNRHYPSCTKYQRQDLMSTQ